MMAEGDWPLRSSSRNRAMAIGSCVAPTPEISTLNWAHAGTTRKAAEAAQKTRLFRGMKEPDPQSGGWFTAK